MAFMSEVGKSPKVTFVLLGVLLLGGLINLIGFGSPYWFEVDVSSLGNTGQSGLNINLGSLSPSSSAGLWQRCTSYFGVRTCVSTQGAGGWFAAVQAMMTLGMLSSLAAGGLLLLFIVTTQFKSKVVVIFIMLGCIGAAAFNVIGIAIFAASYGGPYNSIAPLSWAFYLCCVGSAFFVFCSIMSCVLLSQMRTLMH